MFAVLLKDGDIAWLILQRLRVSHMQGVGHGIVYSGANLRPSELNSTLKHTVNAMNHNLESQELPKFETFRETIVYYGPMTRG